MALPLLAGAMIGAGLLGAATRKTPKYDMSGMNAALDLINKQERNLGEYFKVAGEGLNTQYANLYGQQMGEAINQAASRGIYESPVAERGLGRKRAALAETYATAKSQLAGQQMQAQAGIDAQRVSYLQNLAQLQYQRNLAKMQGQQQVFGAVGSLGGALLGL